MELSVLNIEGQETGRTVSLPDNVFNVEANEHVVWLDVKQHLANKRQGTHKAKERGEVKGSTRKLRKQKGSGFARVGDIKSPILRGGGRIFGPRPRDYGFKINRKTKALARRTALSEKARNNSIFIIEEPNFDMPKYQRLR